MTTAFNISSSNTTISLAKKTKIYTFHYVILSQTHTCKKYNLILPSQSQLPRSRPFTRQSCPNISFLLAYFFRLFHLLFYWPCANTIKNFVFSEEETVMNWPHSQQTDSVKSSEKIPRLSVSKIMSKWQMANVMFFQFLKKSLAERRDFIKMNALCLGFLKWGHMKRVCRRLVCKTCNGFHPTSLHSNPVPIETKWNSHSRNTPEATSHHVNLCNMKNVKLFCMHSLIVPVWIHHRKDISK